MNDDADITRTNARGSVPEVFATFLKLGLTSFGGPIAHLGHFHREIIGRRRWLDESQYAQLVALCQFLPGPASSQLGFAIGLIRGGWAGALAAFIAFTLPSAAMLLLFARTLPQLQQASGRAAIHGLKLLAVAVVAQGLLAMIRSLTPDTARRLIAAASAVAVLASGTALMQLAVVAAGASIGMHVCRHVHKPSGAVFDIRYGTRTGALLISIFGVLLLAAFALQSSAMPLVAVASGFYRAGALVFGGGHVVLPLLEQTVVAPGWVSADDFLAGYGAAQAVPGPMFTLAAFLGARLDGTSGGTLGASVSLLAIFLPGFLIVAGALPYWRMIASQARAVSALAGINAAVVGLLAAAFYDPVWTSAIHSPADFAIALVAFVSLAAAGMPVAVVLVGCVLASLGRAWLAG